jgi:putative hemolysin
MPASPLATMDSPMPASPQNSSSNATGMPSPDSSKNCAARKSSE